MASLTGACRASARLLSSRAAIARGFTSSARCLAAQNFSMPALSPTMTEGNIAVWKVKEGESFSAGDVLLEIETDKATMDVEAQDDGVMVKIMTGDGAKAVQVGTRIAVVAEAGDDVSSIEIPAEEAPKKQEESKEQPKKEEAAASAPAAQQSGKEDGASGKKAASRTSGETFEHRYPLLPSVGHLVKEHGISKEEVNKIKGTGPGGRLLKGDVLAHLGSIKADTPAAISARFEQLSHLDLSNIKVAPAAPKKDAPKDAAPAKKAPAVPEILELKVPVSMAKVLEVQKKIHKSIGVFLPISTFVTRAADVANTDLPAAVRAPTTAELFDQVLGLDKLKNATSHGFYLPQISAIPPASLLGPQPSRASRKTDDIIDILAAPAGKKPAAVRQQAAVQTVPGLSSGANVFSLVVPKTEEARAKAFLERCKLILEEEPGRLVL